MKQRLRVDDVDFWREVVCAHIIHADCTQVDSSFFFDLSMWQTSEIQVSTVSGAAHAWKRPDRISSNNEIDNLILCLQTRGSALQVQDGREVILKPGDLTCADATRPMAMQVDNDFEQLLIHVPRNLFLPSLGSSEGWTGRELGRSSGVGPLVTSFLRSLTPTLDKVTKPTADRLLDTTTSLLFSLLAEHSSSREHDPRLSKNAIRFRAEDYIRRNSRNIELVPGTVATALKISLRYLQGIFHEIGTTPSEFIWNCRLQNSEKDLKNAALSMQSIGEIAFRSGFSDVAHFSRRFKQRYGVTPRDYRATTLLPRPQSVTSGDLAN